MRARYKIKWQDSHHNDIESWAEPVDRYVYGANVPTSEEQTADGHNREVGYRTLLTPSNFESNVRDRCKLPPLYDQLYEVDGDVDNTDGNPFGWTPGGLLKVVKING